MNKSIVIDSSVAVKWFLRDALETNVDLADDILTSFVKKQIELYAPPVFPFEVCNALTKACGHRYVGTRTARLTKEQAILCVRKLLRLPINIATEHEREFVRALEFSVDHSRMFYDMTYLALAMELDCQWCTADDKILKSVPPKFPADRILPLSSLRSSP